MMLEDTSSRAPHLYCQNPESLRFNLHSNLQCNSHALQSRPEGKNRSRKRQNGLRGNIQQICGFGNRLHSIALCWDAQLGIGGFATPCCGCCGIWLNKSRLYCSNAGDPWGRRWWCIFNWRSIDFHDSSNHHWYHWGILGVSLVFENLKAVAIVSHLCRNVVLCVELQVESPIICPLLQKMDENGIFEVDDLWNLQQPSSLFFSSTWILNYLRGRTVFFMDFSRTPWFSFLVLTVLNGIEQASKRRFFKQRKRQPPLTRQPFSSGLHFASRTYDYIRDS